MQQQFVIANLDKLEYLDPTAFGGGGNFWEVARGGRAASVLVMLTSFTNRPLPHDPEFEHRDVVTVFGRWAGDRTAIIGDCHTPGQNDATGVAALPAYTEVLDNYLDISSIIHPAWNRLAEDVGDFLSTAAESRILNPEELTALVAGETELRRRGSALSVRRAGIGRYVVASPAGAGKEYVVVLQEGNCSCGCPAFERSKNEAQANPVCKHIVRAADYALQVGDRSK
jgi:predicted nucleic acid-binding Zn finger protein